MNRASLRFYEELNDFLPPEKRKTRFPVSFWGSPSVKDMIEAAGVPHTAVDLILVNGKSVDFSYRVNNDDDISIYPVFELLDISGIQHLRPAPLRDPKFILDVQLGSLAKSMRMCGFDTAYNNMNTGKEMVDISLDEGRTILTTDRKLLKRNEVTHGYWVRSSDPRQQLIEIINHFQLENSMAPFSRCMKCNTLLSDIDKEKILDKLPDRVRETRNEFRQCGGCGRVYWKGSHYDRMQSFIDELRKSL